MGLTTNIDAYAKAELEGIRKQEILDAWENLSEGEACEAFDEMCCDPEEILSVCGRSAESAYLNYLYLCVK